MSEDLTPQERLKRYKEYLAKLAHNEGRTLKCLSKDSTDVAIDEKDRLSVKEKKEESMRSKTKKKRKRKTSSMSSKEIPKDKGKTIESISEPTSTSPLVRPTYRVKRDPNQFVSPAKRELREAGIHLQKESSGSLVPEGTSPERKKVMLRVKKRSIETRLIQLKRERETLEKEFSRKKVSEEYYRRSLTRLIKESRELQREKKQIEDTMKS